MDAKKYKAVVIGTSAGGFNTVPKILEGLTYLFPLPIMLVQHSDPNNDFVFYIEHLSSFCSLKIKLPDEKESIQPGTVYIAPANYHLLVEMDHTLSLNIDEKEKYCRPSIDVLFETAAYAYKEKLIAVILTGANDDGTDGLSLIKKLGGLTIAQKPEEAYVKTMPLCAINQHAADKILSTSEINKLFKSLIC